MSYTDEDLIEALNVNIEEVMIEQKQNVIFSLIKK